MTKTTTQEGSKGPPRAQNPAPPSKPAPSLLSPGPDFGEKVRGQWKGADGQPSPPIALSNLYIAYVHIFQYNQLVNYILFTEDFAVFFMIEILNNKARHNQMDAEFRQIVFRLAKLKLLRKFGIPADQFRFMDAHCWDFTK